MYIFTEHYSTVIGDHTATLIKRTLVLVPKGSSVVLFKDNKMKTFIIIYIKEGSAIPIRNRNVYHYFHTWFVKCIHNEITTTAIITLLFAYTVRMRHVNVVRTITCSGMNV